MGWHLAQELPKIWAQFCGFQLMLYTLCDPPRAKLWEFLPKLLGATEERAWLMSDIKDEVQSLKPRLNFFLVPEHFGFFFSVFSFSGVNMYAMLTGTLPFTVEPFSLRALYQKMVDKEMNPFPTQLSAGNQGGVLGPVQIQSVRTTALNSGL